MGAKPPLQIKRPSHPIAGLAKRLQGRCAVAAHVLRIRRTEDVTLGQLRHEYRRMREAIGASPREFLRYRLWDERIPLSKRLAFLAWETRRPLEQFFNAEHDAAQVRSKVIGDELFRRAALPLPARLGIWCPPGVACAAADAIRSAAELSALLDRCADGVVFKREFGGGGDFVLIFVTAARRCLRDAAGHEWSLARLQRELSGSHRWLIQARLTAHPQLATIAGSENAATLRIVTCRRLNGHIFPLPATLKVPATRRGIDNFGAGNVAIAVDASGRLGDAVLGLDGPVITSHPTTGQPLAGSAAPHWSEANALARQGHAIFPTLRSVGWDIALTPAGPVILEANVWWGVDVLQQPGMRGLLRGEFVDFVTEIGASRAARLPQRRQAGLCVDPSP